MEENDRSMLIVASLVLPLLLLLQLAKSCSTPNDPFIRQTLVYIDRCKCREYGDAYATCFEIDTTSCVEFPKNFQTHMNCFKLQLTAVRKISRSDFGNMTHLIGLYIELNEQLDRIEPGAFGDIKGLVTLSISYNRNLKTLDEHVFKGLHNLETLVLRRNGFNEFKDFTRSLQTAYMPKLRTIDLGELNCATLDRYDFINLNGSRIANVVLSESQMRFIQRDALAPLRNLRNLSVGETLLTDDNLIDVLKKISEDGIPLRSLNLKVWCIKQKVPRDVFNTIANTTIEELILNRNQFHVIDNNTFPTMPNIKNLVLEESIITDVQRDAFSNFPKLERLYLKGNKLATVPSGVLLPTIKVLDISENSRLGSSYFTLGNKNFVDMLSLTILDLSHNNLRKIYNDTFSGLINLKTLNLFNSNILFITDYSFTELRNLESLDLGQNFFPQRTFQKSTFGGLLNLKYLSLENCRIDHIPSNDLFSYMTSLETLNLKRNLLMDVTPEFAVLKTLKVLNIDENRIKMWHHRLFKDSKMENLTASRNTFTYLTPAMLADMSVFKTIDVSNNPFSCNCEHLIESFNSLTRTKVGQILNILNQTNAYCLLPEAEENTTIVSYYQNNYAICEKKKIRNLIKYLIPSLICVVFVLGTVVLSYIYRWHIRYWMFLIKLAFSKKNQCTKKENVQGHTNYLYDAFVSYSTEDRNFVIRLVNMLENYEPFLKLCVYERDFEIGTIISESVLECLLRSRKTLIILSNSYIKSQWCTWEAQVAENYRLFFENEHGECVNDSLIIIKLGNILNKNISPMLKYLMKTRIYLQWDSSDGKQEQFWEKLRNALVPALSGTEEKFVDVKL